MQLLWLYYKSSKNPRYILCLELGRRSGKLYSIETKAVDNGSRMKILSAKSTLDNLSLDRRISWIRHHCPNAMLGFKTLSEDKMNIINTYPINKMR